MMRVYPAADCGCPAFVADGWTERTRLRVYIGPGVRADTLDGHTVVVGSILDCTPLTHTLVLETALGRVAVLGHGASDRVLAYSADGVAWRDA